MDKKGTHNVKIPAEKITMVGEPTGEQVGKKTSGQVNELIVLFSSLEECVFSHANVRASSTLFIWLNENVHFSYFDINTSMLT